MMAGNLNLSLASHNTLQVVAGTDAEQVSIGIEGLFRYITTTITAAVSGAAGTKSIFVTCGPNSFAAGGGGSGETDNTVYAFALNIQPKGSTPITNGTTLTNFRLIGELDWDGSNITVVRQFYGAGDTTMGLMPTADTTTMIPLFLKAIASQTSALTQWQDSSGAVIAQVPPSQPGTGDGTKAVATTAWFQSQPNIFQPGDLIFSGAGTRAGALLCDGGAYSRTTYAALFAAISTTFGIGDGTTTFNVPNYLGRGILGAGAGSGLTVRTLGQTGGAETFTMSASQLPAHTHTITDPGHIHTLTDPGHVHAITDPTHQHFYAQPIGVPTNVQPGGVGIEQASGTTGLTSASGTGITINSHTTGITLASHTTGITGTNANTGGGGSISLMQPWATANIFIKT